MTVGFDLAVVLWRSKDILFSLFWRTSSFRQRYVELLARIPKQMNNLYKEMMAQRVMNKHITDELLNFKEAVAQLTRSNFDWWCIPLFYCVLLFVNKSSDCTRYLKLLLYSISESCILSENMTAEQRLKLKGPMKSWLEQYGNLRWMQSEFQTDLKNCQTTWAEERALFPPALVCNLLKDPIFPCWVKGQASPLQEMIGRSWEKFLSSFLSLNWNIS